MRSVRVAISTRVSLLSVLAFVTSCGIAPLHGTEKTDEPSSSNGAHTADPGQSHGASPVDVDDKADDDADKASNAESPIGDYPVCTLPDGVDNAPTTITATIAMINALPKPVSIACFVQLLPRPLYVNATSSQLSVQPATSEATPRIFIFRDSLILTFVPAGEGAKAIEMSYLTSTTTSIKAEIGFPVTETIPADAGFTAILTNDGGGTTCAGCHSQESAAPASYGANAFVSKALKPMAARDVSLFDLRFQSEICGSDQSERCANLRAVFDHGEVLQRSFPVEMPTLFLN